MILTTTLNPSVDIRYTMDSLTLDTINRVDAVSKTAGGKGLNVARVLKQVDEQVIATGFLGGTLGTFIEEQLESLSIENAFVSVEENTRNCIAIIHNNQQTEILEKGPKIARGEATKFIEQFSNVIQKVNLATISGSLPAGLTSTFYQSLITIAAEHHTPVLLDTSGSILSDLLKEKAYPYLIKPNESEFAELVGKELSTEIEILQALQSDLFTPIPWVIVTLGSKGAFIKCNDTYYRAEIPSVQAVNPVGSGDSVIAGFAKGLNQELEIEEIIKLGLSFGVLNAMEDQTGYINVEQIDSVMNEVMLSKL